jgi:predicted AAA+ superfamily ATPase
MMFPRKINSYLQAWKVKKERKPLILRGARQVGKTSTVLSFGKESFEQVVHINLEKPEHARLFPGEASLKEFETIVNVAFGQKLVPGKTLLFIDEIQEKPHLLKLLRFFFEEMPQLHVVAAGSLFEVKLKESGFPIPVGRVEFAYLYPLDFFEYLQATGQESLLSFLKNISLGEKIPNSLHEKALAAFREFVLVGGMPEAVKQYAESSDMEKVNSVYSNLMISFQDDVYKYSTQAEAKYLTFVLEQAPLFAGLSITYEKFAGSNYRSREMAKAFSTLAKAMLLFQVQATKSSTLPLLPVGKKPPKLLFLDVGLVNFQMGIQSEYLRLKDLAGFYQGRIAEQIVGQQLLSSFVNTSPRLFYWYKKTGSEAEVDFCLTRQGGLLGLEVKSGSAGRLKSIWEFVEETGNDRVIRFYSGPAKVEKPLISLPFYLLPRWKELAVATAT